MSFEHLLSPGRIGSMELRNRILMCPMGDSIANDDGTVSDRQIAYYGARARGGAGLIIMGSVGVAYPSGSYAQRQTAASDDRYIPGLRRIADEVHGHGAKIAAQIVHDAANSRYDMEQGKEMLVSALPTQAAPDELTMMITPAEMQAMSRPYTAPGSKYAFHVATEDDILQAIEWFAAAAARCHAAGFDGIELHAGHGYLLDWFLSPSKNTRDDRWGGSPENRARFLVEVIEAVRASTNDEIPVWLRMNAEEPHTPGGMTLDEAIGVARFAENAGAAALHVSSYGNPMVATGITDGHTPHSPGNIVRLAAAIKPHTSLPVITFGRIEPEHAEEILAAGQADFIGMGRKLLADPDLPNKLAEGRADDVRPCIYQYRCIGNIFVMDGVACVSNAATARGDEDAPPSASNPRHVLIAGGGPAGMEAARLLAAGGHRVTLADAGVELGGRLLVAGACDPVMEAMRRYLIRQVEQAGVDIRLGQRVDASFAGAVGADLVVDATGTEWPAVDPLGPYLRGDAKSPGATVRLDGGDKPALSIADRLAAKGHEVTIVEPSGVFGMALGLPGRFRLVHDLRSKGARTATEVGDDETFDLTVDTARAAPSPLAIDGVECHRIGDVTGTGGLEAAFIAARELAFSLAK